ncbi:MAG: O-phospho-L-seryl-tRNA:Cys-tRNA synthase [Methanolinea sp.]|jgi:Sep-tRNA:Cys-tRNA synthetase|nr:O-phospho-L-seryl-tRNA:Cys-tRNA synthase [Methanolinea sp.]
MKCAGPIEVRDLDESCINIDPIQVGGRLTPEAMKAVIAYGDGYSICDHCRKPFRLDFIKTPPVDVFFRDLADFLHMDVARVVPGARRGFQAVADTYVQKGDPVLITALSHYTEVLAVEGRGGILREIPKTPENTLTADAASEKIEAVIRETGKAPSLLFLDHVDYQYGNLHPVKEITKVAHQYDIPVLVNGAYTVGIMEVDGRDIGADFVVGSGHKSMAAPAPSGVLAATSERAAEVFRTTSVKTDVTSRTFGIKEVEMMGCTLMGVTLVGMMASFPRVRERVKRWDQELAHSSLVVDALKSIEGTRIRSEYPRKHTLTRVDTTGSFDEVAKTHKKRGYFLSSALKARGIAGTIPGATKVWKFNTYGMTRAQAGYVADSLAEIAVENGLRVG